MVVSDKAVSRPKQLRIGRILGATLAVLGGGAAVAVALRGPGTLREGPAVSCASRVIVVDTSSSDRSPVLSNLADRVINAAAQSAVVCSDSLSVYGVSGGGAESTIITTDDLSGFAPIGPTAQIRSLRLNSAQRSALDGLISARLRAAYDTGDPGVTSIAALYLAASEHLVDPTQVLLITDGVNDDSQVNLNRPLASGAGSELARNLPVSQLPNATVTIVGLAQVDESSAPPSPLWPTEIQNFNAVLCHESRARLCRLYAVASVSESLNPPGGTK